MTGDLRLRFRDYPVGFKALTAADIGCVVFVVAYESLFAVTNSPFSTTNGQIISLALNAAIIIALGLILWRYRLRTEPENRKMSVYLLLILIVLLFLAGALFRLPV